MQPFSHSPFSEHTPYAIHVLDSGITAVNKTAKNSYPHGAYVLVGEVDLMFCLSKTKAKRKKVKQENGV